MDAHTIVGTSNGGGQLSLSLSERLQHVAILGATGVGKSTLLRAIVAQDMARGDGVMLVDPHGDLAESVLTDVPPWRHNQVCYLNLADLEHPVGLNVLEDTLPDDRARAVDAVVAAMRAIWHESWGPRLETILRHGATALIETPNASLVLLPRLLTDDAFRARIVARLVDPLTRAFFERRFELWRDTYRDEAIEPVLNKVEAFLSFPATRNILGQGRSSLDIAFAMGHQRVIVANLAKGLIGETAAHLMGALLIARVQAAGMGRAGEVASERVPFHLVIDEAQNFGTEALVSLISEARKYAVSVCLATQYLSALSKTTQAALLGSVGTLACFRVGSEDAQVVSPLFDRLHESFNAHALHELARGEAMVVIADRDARRVVVGRPPETTGSGETVKRQSRRHYGRVRADVEAKIMRALGYAVAARKE